MIIFPSSLSAWIRIMNLWKLVVKRLLYAIRVRLIVIWINFWRICKMLTWVVTVIHNFVKKYMEIYDNCFPYKKIKRSDRRLNKPWVSLGLLKSVKKKNKLYTAISIYVVGSKLQEYATSTKQLQPHPLETPIFLSSKWLSIRNLRCMDEALLILLIVIH